MPESTPFKIAILSDAIPQRNGAGSYYYDLLENLKPYVKYIELISPGQEINWQGPLSIALPGDATQRVGLPAFGKIRRHLDTIQPDVIIAATPGPFGLYAKKLAKRYGARYYVGYHTSFENLTKLFWKPIMGFMIKRYFIVMNNMLFKTANAVVANSEEMLANAERFGAPSTRLIGTPLPHHYIDAALPPWPRQVKSVLFAGRLSAEKNISGILNSAAELPTISFSIAGDGPLRNEVESYCHEHSNLVYHGWIERDRLLELIDQHDMLILPSFVESFGTIALEAMARGRIVLVSDRCGILNWPELKAALYHYTPPEDLTTAILRITALDEETLAQKGQQAQTAALALNDWNIDDWLSIFRESA